MFISELFKDIQDAISLIIHCRTIFWFRPTSSSIFTILDVRSIFILSSTLDEYLEVKIRARDRQYSSCLLILWTKSHQDPKVIDLNVPRHAQYLHNAWKKHQDAVYWVDINLDIEKGLTFYQTRSNATIFQVTLPAYCIPKVVRPKTGEVLYEKGYMSPRSPPKDLIETRMEERTSLSTCSTTRSRAAIKKFPIEPTMQDGRETSRSQVIDVSSFCVEPRANGRFVNSKTSPCVPAPRPHLVTHVRVVDVLNLHKEVVSACQAAPHTTPHTQHNTTQHTTQHTHHTQHHNTQHHTETETQRQRQRETERNRERQRKRDKTRQNKKREDETMKEKKQEDERGETRRWKRREETGEDEREG